MSAILEADHVSKRFAMGGILSRSNVDAVIDASFTIQEGQPEVFTIVGQSGCGKTTLARMILGLETPPEGEIRLPAEAGPTAAVGPAGWSSCATVQPVFQNPFETFNPLKQVDRYLRASARVLLGARGREGIEGAMDEALQKVGLSLARSAGATPMSSPVGSCSASRSPARSFPTPRRSLPTSRCRWWTLRCGCRSSTCCATCAITSACGRVAAAYRGDPPGSR